MSVHNSIKRLSVPSIKGHKAAGGAKLVMLTAYTKPMAQLLDPHCDILLVGDSLGMVLYGMDSTLAVTLDMMIMHTKAVMRGSAKACVVLDMPFGSYQESKEQAFRNAARAMAESGAQAIKMEGGVELAETVSFLVARGIPVMAHIGLMPQHVNTMGGFKAQGREADAIEKWCNIAKAMEAAGVFSMVIEGTLEPVARAVTQAVGVPTIGIGASPACDGQVLVAEDLLGLFTDFTPKFAKKYVNVAESISAAVAQYAAEVRSGEFPAAAHCFGVMPPVAE